MALIALIITPFIINSIRHSAGRVFRIVICEYSGIATGILNIVRLVPSWPTAIVPRFSLSTSLQGKIYCGFDYWGLECHAQISVCLLIFSNTLGIL